MITLNPNSNPESNSFQTFLIKIDLQFDYKRYQIAFPNLDWVKIESYYQLADRIRCFTSQLLQKYYLAKLLAIKPTEILIKYSQDNKPYLSTATNSLASIQFNLSHSGDYVVLAASCDRSVKEIGVDIEQINAGVAVNELAEIVFSATEQQIMANSSTNFFKLWTKKEALLKAMGCGFNHNFFKTTNLNLDTIEHFGQYTISCQQLDNYFISICILNQN